MFVVWCSPSTCAAVLSAAATAGYVGPRYAWVLTNEPFGLDARGAYNGTIAVVASPEGTSDTAAEMYNQFLAAWATLAAGGYPGAANVSDYAG